MNRSGVRFGKRGAPDGVLASARWNAGGLLRRRTKERAPQTLEAHALLSNRPLVPMNDGGVPWLEGPGYFRVDSSASRTASFWRAEVCTLGCRASQ